MKKLILKSFPITLFGGLYFFVWNVEQLVPAFFHEAYRSNFCSQILLKCNKYVWCVKYNAEQMTIYGLQRFMLYYGVRTCSFIQFDYYGESMFIVSIFSEYAIECEYPEIAPPENFLSTYLMATDQK